RSGGRGKAPRQEQKDAGDQGEASGDGIEEDRVRPGDVDGEEPDVRYALRGEERDARDRHSDEASEYQKQPNHGEWSHRQPPFVSTHALPGIPSLPVGAGLTPDAIRLVHRVAQSVPWPQPLASDGSRP